MIIKAKGVMNANGNNPQRQLLWLLVWLALAASLLSFDSNDPSFNHATVNNSNNVLGLFGSYIADFVYQFVGMASMVFIITKLGIIISQMVGVKIWQQQSKNIALIVMLP
ncbi:MAG: DNA translocase FtsK 4TM domain-containing protein, partial [Pseudomonadota bacterium]